MKNELARGDVVQILPDAGHLFDGAFAVVTKVFLWGVRAEVYGPKRETYPVRVANGCFERIGRAVHMRKD